MTLAQAGATLDVLDPRTGERVGTIPAGSAEDADRAVKAARAAQPGWAARPAAERGSLLKEAAHGLREHAAEIAEIQTRENGKPEDDSRAGVSAGIETIEQYAELGPLHRGRSLAGEPGATDVMVYEPRGVAAAVVPWNDPIAIAGGIIGACLVTGNTLVLKPSEKTPLSTVRMAELMQLPDGVLEILLGDARAGRPLVAHPHVDLVLHTGSVETGREIAIVCAEQFKKAVLELGGKDALIVDEDVDPRWAAEQAAAGAFANAGQICTSVERIYVHEAVAGAFVEALVEEAGRTEIGPLIDEGQREVVHRHVSEAAERGARVLRGGELPPEGAPGFFYPPTVVVDAPDDSALMREETFGPVAAVRTVESFDAGIRAANATEYGLAANVLTASEEHARRAAEQLVAGTVKVNGVWGGAPGGSAEPRRSSGMGFGYGPELLDEVTTTKVVHIEPAQRPGL